MKRFFMVLGGLIVSVFSCKQNELVIDQPEQYSRIFMPLANETTVEHQFPIADDWFSIPFGAGYGGYLQLTQPVTVTFEIRNDLIEVFNETNGTAYRPLPEDSYMLSADQAVIPAGGTGSNSIDLRVNTIRLGGTKPCLLPISIKEVSGNIPVSETLHTAYLVISGRYDSNPFELYPRDGWEIVDYSSDENDGPTTGGRAHHAIDGNWDTFWHSQWRRDANGWRPGPPHHLTIDMQAVHELHGLEIHGRKGSNHAYLFPRNVMIETSQDGERWTSFGPYTIEASAANTSATVFLEESVTARYVSVIVLSNTGNTDTAAIVEILAF